jgi:hypothetical protein
MWNPFLSAERPTAAGEAMTELLNPASIAEEIEVTLAEVEQHLLALVQDGARGAEKLAEVLQGLNRVVLRIPQIYLRLQEVQGRRDLGFQMTARLEAIRKQSLWLYRKARLEQCFFAKLRLERGLRDAIYRQIVETYQEMSALDEIERELRGRPEEALTQELLREPTEISL